MDFLNTTSRELLNNDMMANDPLRFRRGEGVGGGGDGISPVYLGTPCRGFCQIL